MPTGCGPLSEIVKVVPVNVGLSAPVEDMRSARALVCGGPLESIMYPCHDLLRNGVSKVGVVPHLCDASGRSGELSRSRTSSHLEHVLGVKIIESLTAATKWLLPGGPALPRPARRLSTDVDILVQSADGTELNDEQRLIISLLLSQDIIGIKLYKIGKGYTSALKFFCVPLVLEQETRATGATTFIKMGKEEELNSELNITQYMMELLGNFCPQVLNYAEHGGLAALHLSLADLSTGAPKGFADLYRELMLPSRVGTELGRALLERIQGAVDFVFGQLLQQLHAARRGAPRTFSAFDELGFCHDLPGGKSGVEKGLQLSTAFLLEKLWRKSPGDGGFASSVLIYMREILGEAAAVSETLSFLDTHPLRLPNVYTDLLASAAKLSKLREASMGNHRLCFTHGDLHGDNVMVDSKDNRFLIDFGKTGIGHCLEDVTYLESHVVLSYTELETDEELADALDLVLVMAPPSGRLDAEPGDLADIWATARGSSRAVSPRIDAMWAVVKRMRFHMRKSLRNIAADEAERRMAAMIAALLLLRNSLFFLAARENREQPRRRRLALALACAYAQSAQALS